MSRDDLNKDNRIINDEDLVVTSLDEDEDYYYDEVEIVTHEEGRPALSIVEDSSEVKRVSGYKKPMDFDVDAELAAMEAHEKGLDEDEDLEDTKEDDSDWRAALDPEDVLEADLPDEEASLDEDTANELDDELEAEYSDGELDDEYEAEDLENHESRGTKKNTNIIAFPGGDEEEEERRPRHSAKRSGPGFVGKLIVALIILALLGAAAVGGMAFKKHNKAKKQERTNDPDDTLNVATDKDASSEPEDKYSWWTKRDVTATGNRVFMGEWKQGPEGEKLPIAWMKAGEYDGKELLVSEYVIDLFAFSSDGVVQWENSDLRAYLNGEFLEAAFSAKEQEKIVLASLDNEDNETYHTLGGHDTEDKLFVLGNEELGDFAEGINTKSLAVPYVLERLNSFDSDNTIEYWFRMPGERDKAPGQAGHVAVVNKSGEVDSTGRSSREVFGVRVALFINIE